jgi:hypothetical protein
MTKSLTTKAVLLSLGLLLHACSSTPSAPVPAIVDVNGGLSGSGTLGSVFIVDGTGFGDLTAQTSGYSLDFRDATSSAVVASTTSSVNFASGAWKSLFITATVPTTGLTAGITYKVTVTTPGGTSNAVSFLILASQPYVPNTVWTKSASSLPAARQGFPAAVATIGSGATAATYVYALGGNTASSGAAGGKAANTAAVSFSKLDPTAGAVSLASWTQTTALPAVRGFSAAVVATSFNSKVSGNGTIYVLGGLDATGAATSTIYQASLNPDGTIPAASPAAGSWTALTATPLPQALYAHGAVIFHGHIYVAGGNDTTGTPVAKVYSALINADGTLGAWTTLAADLPDKRAHHQLVTAAGNLYVVAGTNVAVDPISNVQSSGAQSTVYYNAINLKDGTLTGATWTTTSSLNKSREKFSAVVAGGGVLASGGLYNGAANGSSEQEFASINTDGSLATFGSATGAYTISKATGGYNFYNQSSVYFADTAGNPHVLILGGAEVSNTVSNGVLHAEVWYQ